MTARRITAGLVGTVVIGALAACSPDDRGGHADRTETTARATTSDRSSLSDIEVDAELPVTWSQSVLVDTGWTVEPQRHGSYLVGFAAGVGRRRCGRRDGA